MLVQEIIALGVDVNFALPSTGDRALHVAVMFDAEDVVDLLLAQDAIELNATNASGQTCLFGCSNATIAKLLLERGLDASVEDADGETALTIAEALEDDAIVALLTSS